MKDKIITCVDVIKKGSSSLNNAVYGPNNSILRNALQKPATSTIQQQQQLNTTTPPATPTSSNPVASASSTSLQTVSLNNSINRQPVYYTSNESIIYTASPASYQQQQPQTQQQQQGSFSSTANTFDYSINYSAYPTYSQTYQATNGSHYSAEAYYAGRGVQQQPQQQQSIVYASSEPKVASANGTIAYNSTTPNAPYCHYNGFTTGPGNTGNSGFSSANSTPSVTTPSQATSYLLSPSSTGSASSSGSSSSSSSSSSSVKQQQQQQQASSSSATNAGSSSTTTATLGTYNSKFLFL